MLAGDSVELNNLKVRALTLMGSLPGILLMVLLVALLDVWSTWEVPLGLFYLLPICVVAIHHRVGKVVVTVALSVVGWTVVDLLTQRPVSHVWVGVLNVLVRVVALGGLGWFVHRSRSIQARERDLVQFVLHDLRNPATSLGLAVDFMTERTKGGGTDPYLVQSRHAVSQIHRLIDSLLDLTRLERGKLPVHREAFSVPDVAQMAVQTMSPIADHLGIAVRVVSSTESTSAVGDSRLIQRVLENLLSNALKASQRGTRIDISWDCPVQGCMHIRVKDEGPGIPEHMAKRVFDPYVQLELKKAGHAAGTGLGLAFCRAAIREMRGQIWVESQEGEGTTMVVSLPADQGPAPLAELSLQSQSSLDRKAPREQTLKFALNAPTA